VNNYVSLYFLAFWDRNLAQLAQNMVTFIVVKQFLYNGIDWFKDSVVVRAKIARIDFIYSRLIEKNPENEE
jgi:hypothetical protein